MRASLQSTKIYTLLAILVWFFSALIAGYFGVFAQPGVPPTYLGLFTVVPLVGFMAMYFGNSRFPAFTHSISLPLIVGAHVWRIVGLGCQ